MQRLRVSGAEAPHYLRLDGHHCLHVLKAQGNYAMIAPFYPNNPFCTEYRYRTGMPTVRFVRHWTRFCKRKHNKPIKNPFGFMSPTGTRCVTLPSATYGYRPDRTKRSKLDVTAYYLFILIVTVTKIIVGAVCCMSKLSKLDNGGKAMSSMYLSVLITEINTYL
jgi:hypothetical protein